MDVLINMPIFAQSNHQNVTIMKKSVFTTLVYLFSVLLTVAAPIDEQSARKLAGDFLRGKMSATRSSNTSLTRAITGVVDGPDAAIYVFNADDAFVIVSGDDSTLPVLGYSDKGCYDVNNVPDGLKDLIRYYQQEVKHFSTSTRGETITIHEPVAPLIKTLWKQSAPYNNMCPMDTIENERSVTGCVATAVAQVMYYHQHPATTYDWDKMNLEYGSNETGESVDAVAKLMADIGIAFNMEYSSTGSSADMSIGSEILRYDYGYASSTEFVDRYDYTAKEWDELIYNEIKLARPVLLSGVAVSPADGLGGHAFILDGYDDKGYYHVNWGWGGLSDGFFLLSVLNPDQQSIGGNSNSSGYSFSIQAIIGIAPAETPLAKTARLSQYDFYIKDNIKDETQHREATYTRSSTYVDFKGLVFEALVFNTMNPKDTRTYDIAFDLYQGDKYIKTLDSGEGFEYKHNYGGRFYSDPVSLGKDLPDGTYQIRFRAKESNKAGVDWDLCYGGYGYYIELNINGLTMTAKSHGLMYQATFDGLTVNRVDPGETRQQAKKMVLKINITNNSVVANAPIFLWGNSGDSAEGSKLLTGVGCGLDPGESGDVEVEYTPQRSGSFTFYLSTGYKTLSDTLYTFNVDVAEMSMADVNLAAKFEIEGTQQAGGWWNIEGTSIKGTLKLTNNGTELYDDVVGLVLFYNTAYKGTYHAITSLSLDAKVPVGETVSLPFEFKDLSVGYYYGFRFQVMEKGAVKTVLNLPNNPICTILGDTGIRDVLLEQTDADVYNMQGVRKGKAAGIKSLPKGIYIINKKKVINK